MIIEDPVKIRERYLEHFGEILKNVPAETDEEKAQEQLIELVFKRMMTLAEKTETRYTTKDELEAAAKELKRKKAKDKSGWRNEIVLETGDGMIECLLALVNKMEHQRVWGRKGSNFRNMEEIYRTRRRGEISP